MFRKLALSLALAAGVALPLATSAEAAIGDGALGARAQLTQVAGVEKTQFFFGGYNYCWYPGGWRGPGWYWCGYAWRTGFGWGGGYGWNGWRGGGPGWGRPGWHGGPGAGWRAAGGYPGRAGAGWRAAGGYPGRAGAGWRAAHHLKR